MAEPRAPLDLALVGAGALGGRHLQALARLAADAGGGRIAVVDPDPAAAATMQARLAEIGLDGPGGPVLDMRAACDGALPPAPALAVVATASRHRLAALTALLDACAPRAIVLEKVLFSDPAEYDAADALLARSGARVWVNCPRASAPGYGWLRDRLAGAGPVRMVVTGSRLNLLSNAIHFLELFRFLVGRPDAALALDGRGLVRPAEPARRPGYFDAQGDLRAETDRGDTLALHSARGGAAPMALSVFADDGARFSVDERADAVVCEAPDGTATRRPLGLMQISELAPVWAQALAGEAIALPSYADSAALHRAFLACIAPLAPAGGGPLAIT